MANSKDSKILDVNLEDIKKAAEKSKPKPPEKLSLGEAYEKVNNTVDNFARQFMEFLPNVEGVELERLLVLDKILGLKETSKILIDNIVIKQSAKSGGQKNV
jgi:hypothetical protein